MTNAVAFGTDRELTAPTEMMPVAPHPLRVVEGVVEAVRSETGNAILGQASDLVTRFPESPTVLARLASAAVNAGEKAPAVTAARKGARLAADQGDQPALLACALAMIAAGQSSEAIAWLEPVENEAARILEADVLGSNHRYTDALGKLTGVDGAAGLRGWLYVETGEYGQAIHDLRRALGDSPQRVDLLSNLGYAYASLGQRRKAYRTASLAMALDPDNREVALNLVSYQVAAGDYDRALALLRRLRRRYPSDPKLAAASAEVLWRLRRGPSALKQLLSVRYFAPELSPIDEAELGANIAVMQWRLGELSKGLTIQTLRDELERSEFRSIGVGRMLAQMLVARSSLEQLVALRAVLSEHHDSSKLLQLDFQIAFTAGEYDQALQIGHAWSLEEPFNSGPITGVTHLLCEVKDAYREAAEVGEKALRRIPGSELLRNNVAFALAVSGQPVKAKKILDDAVRPEMLEKLPFVAVTRGAIRFAQGDVEGGRAEYARAVQMAEKVAARSRDSQTEDEEDLPMIILLRRDLVMLELGLELDLKETLILADRLRDTENTTGWVLLGKLDRLLRARGLGS